MLIFSLLAIAWFLSGAASFIYWWSSEHGNINGVIGLTMFAGLIGPLAYPLGYIIHGIHRP